MKKKRVLIGLTDVGVVNAIYEALPLLAEKYELLVAAQSGVKRKQFMAYEKLAELFPPQKMKQIGITDFGEIDSESAENIVKDFNPSTVLCGFSDRVRHHKNVDTKLMDAAIEQARFKHIKTIGILEAVSMSPEVLSSRIDDGDPTPKKIIVSPGFMSGMLLREELFNQNEIVVLPMPKYAHFSEIINAKSSSKEFLRELNGLDDKTTCVIFSTSHDEIRDVNAIDMLAKAVCEMRNVKVLLTFHPKEKPTTRQEYLNRIKDAEELQIGSNPLLEAVCDLASGNKGIIMSVRSSLLFDAAVCGARAACVAVDRTYVLEPASQMSIAKRLDDVEGIKEALKDAAKNRRWYRATGDIHHLFRNPNSVEQFVAGLEKLIG